MILYLKKVRELLKKFIRVQVKHVPRSENSQADALAKLATATQEDLGRLIPIEHLPEPSVSIDNGEVSFVMFEPRWMCSDPRAQSDPNGESKNGFLGMLGLFLFIFRVIKFSFFKSVATRIPCLTRMADPNRSPVYSDVFIYLIKTFYYVISLRKRFQFRASP